MMHSLRDLPERYRVILCDIWGCVHDGVRAFPSAVALLRDWRGQGRTIVLLTNAPRPSVRVRAHLARLGVDAGAYDAVVSSGDTGVDHVLTHHADEALGFIGREDDREALAEAGLTRWDDERSTAVVCMGYRTETEMDPAAHDDVLAAMRARDAELLCFNPDRIVGHGDLLVPCAGLMAERYEAMGGRTRYFGKPHRPIYDRALAVAAECRGRPVGRDEVLAVGDGPATDIKGAVDYGLDAVLVTGGIEAARAEAVGDEAFLAELRARPGLESVAPVAMVLRLE